MEMQPYDLYRADGIEYNYIINVTVKVGNVEDILPTVINLLKDEDLLKMYFKNVGLGRVYGKVVYLDNKLQFIFGISTIDAENEFDVKELQQNIQDFIIALNKNIEDTKLDIKESDISMNIISENYNINNIDKKLVTEGVLTFIKENNQVCMKLTDDGMIEHNLNNELVETYPFAKLKVVRECRQLIQNGYALIEELNNNVLDNPQETKKELEQQIEDVEEIQDLKDELDDKMDNLMEENVEVEQPKEFPVTEFTTKVLSVEDELDLEHNLTNEQQDWILNNICDDVLDFETLLRDFITILTINTEPIISINEFIHQIATIINK